MSFQWDQSRLNEALKILLDTMSTEKIPYVINKKLFFVALRAMAATPKRERIEIAKDLSRVIIAKRKDGTSRMVPIGFVVAAKSASKKWPDTAMRLGEKRKSGRANRRLAWLKFLEKRNSKQLGSRAAAAGFLRLGWLSVVRELGPHIKNKSGAPSQDTGGARLRGSLKGNARAATSGWNVSGQIENTAQAKSDKRNGLIRIGSPPLEKAFRDELADFLTFLEAEGMKEAVDKFNAMQ